MALRKELSRDFSRLSKDEQKSLDKYLELNRNLVLGDVIYSETNFNKFRDWDKKRKNKPKSLNKDWGKITNINKYRKNRQEYWLAGIHDNGDSYWIDTNYKPNIDFKKRKRYTNKDDARKFQLSSGQRVSIQKKYWDRD